jgi:hypothetical protein
VWFAENWDIIAEKSGSGIYCWVWVSLTMRNLTRQENVDIPLADGGERPALYIRSGISPLFYCPIKRFKNERESNDWQENSAYKMSHDE